jgi:glutamate-1-semialdehyde 2,1-aminomutase
MNCSALRSQDWVSANARQAAREMVSALGQADLRFASSTPTGTPTSMAAMNEFLRRLEEPAISALYDDLDGIWDRRAEALNRHLRDAGLPVQVANLSSIWTICYTRPSGYNWMFQYYLRAEGLALSWVGTGRLIFSLNYTEADYQAVAERFVAAAEAMQCGGWWWEDPLASNRKIKRRILREMIAHRLSPQWAPPSVTMAEHHPIVDIPAH